MKKIFRLSGAFFLSVFFLLTVVACRAQGSVSFQVFYDQLAPYGSWVNYNQYGYVWVPKSVSAGFRPYGNSGHWVFTDDGWTWLSDYSWGWAPFHYGNWFYDDAYGWMWMPGYDWAPAWVTWGEYGGNYCWAPISPDVQIGSAWDSYRPPAYYWTFVPRVYIGRPDMNTHYIHYNRNVTAVKNIAVIHNINAKGGRPQYMRGPQAANVEKYTHSTVRPAVVRESARPGRPQVQNGQLSIYRPAVSRSPAGRAIAPGKVKPLQSLKSTALPGYNHNVRPGSGPANHPGANPARPVPNNRPTVPNRAATVPHNPPAVNKPARTEHATPRSSPRPSTPGTIHSPGNKPPMPAGHQPVRPVPKNQAAPRNTGHVPVQPRPAPAQPHSRALPQQRPAPQPRPVQPSRPAPQPQPVRPPAQAAPRPAVRPAAPPVPRSPENAPGDRNPH